MAAPGKDFVRLLVVLACLTAAGCANRSATDIDEFLPDLTVIDPPHLYRSLQSGVARETRIVIRDSAAWQAFWRDLVQGGTTVPTDPPFVDFAVQHVAVTALGARERAGYHIAITGFQRTAGHTVVTVRKTTPPGDCPSSPVITTPIAVTAIAAGTSVSFTEFEEDTPCPGGLNGVQKKVASHAERC